MNGEIFFPGPIYSPETGCYSLHIGAAGGWTDGIYPLEDAVQPDSGRWIGLVDWGYLNQLRMLYEDELHLLNTDPADVKQVLATNCLLIQHTEDKQIFPGVNDRFRKAAEALGYTEKVQRVVHDRNGRPVFELFRLEKTTQQLLTEPRPRGSGSSVAHCFSPAGPQSCSVDTRPFSSWMRKST